MLLHQFSDHFLIQSVDLAQQAVGAGNVRRTPPIDLGLVVGDVQAEVPFLSSGGGTLSATWVESDDGVAWTPAAAGEIVAAGTTGWHASARRVRSFNKRFAGVEVEVAVAPSTVGAVVLGQKLDR